MRRFRSLSSRAQSANRGKKGRRLIGAPKLPNGCQYVSPIRRQSLNLNAELKRRTGIANEISLVDLEEAKKVDDRRDGRFADADRPNIGGFDDRDRASAIERTAEDSLPSSTPLCRRPRSRSDEGGDRPPPARRAFGRRGGGGAAGVGLRQGGVPPVRDSRSDHSLNLTPSQ